MKKKLFSGFIVLVLLVIAGVGGVINHDERSLLLDVMLVNVEALAADESGGCPGGSCTATLSGGASCSACCSSGTRSECEQFGCRCR